MLSTAQAVTIRPTNYFDLNTFTNSSASALEIVLLGASDHRFCTLTTGGDVTLNVNGAGATGTTITGNWH